MDRGMKRWRLGRSDPFGLQQAGNTQEYFRRPLSLMSSVSHFDLFINFFGYSSIFPSTSIRSVSNWILPVLCPFFISFNVEFTVFFICHFGVILESFWSHFGVILESFWSHLLVVLESFLGHFWVKCGSFLHQFLVIFMSFFGSYSHDFEVISRSFLHNF